MYAPLNPHSGVEEDGVDDTLPGEVADDRFVIKSIEAISTIGTTSVICLLSDRTFDMTNLEKSAHFNQ